MSIPEPPRRQLIRQRRRRRIRQCQTFWCWAAVLQELHRLRRAESPSIVPPTQCQIAQRVFPDKSCDCLQWGDQCDPTRRSKCNDKRDLGLDLWVGLSLFPEGFDLRDVASHLASGRPVVGRFSARGEQRHYVLITSITTDPPWELEVADPWEPGTLKGGIPLKNGTCSFDGWSLDGAYFIQEVIP